MIETGPNYILFTGGRYLISIFFHPRNTMITIKQTRPRSHASYVLIKRVM